MSSKKQTKTSLIQKIETIYAHKLSYLFPILALFMTLISVRVLITKSSAFVFLVWNVLLAILPLFFVIAASYFKKTSKNVASYSHKHNFIIGLFLFLWFIFFPNAPYLNTDMIHIYPGSSRKVPYWFDVMLFINLVVIAFVTSFESLKIFLDDFIKEKRQFWVAALIWFITCVGIYIGREWRFNSWDILVLPTELLNQEIDPKTLIPFLTVWPLSLFVWFWVWFKNEQKES